jgi:hypothetical protein
MWQKILDLWLHLGRDRTNTLPSEFHPLPLSFSLLFLKIPAGWALPRPFCIYIYFLKIKKKRLRIYPVLLFQLPSPYQLSYPDPYLLEYLMEYVVESSRWTRLPSSEAIQ